jgi:hypothetical protein
MAVRTRSAVPISTIAISSDDLVCGGNYPSRYSLRVSDFAEAAAAHAVVQSLHYAEVHCQTCPSHTLMSLVIVLVSSGLIPHASMRDAVMGIERSQQPDEPLRGTSTHTRSAS